MASISILIIKSEASLVKAIEKSLKRLGYSVAAIAKSGMEASVKGATNQPDLILMDIDEHILLSLFESNIYKQ